MKLLLTGGGTAGHIMPHLALLDQYQKKNWQLLYIGSKGLEKKLIAQKIERVDDHPFPQTDKPMTVQEKKEWNKEKLRRKQEFFAQRKKTGWSR